ncbi:MAG TPA: hypothetical protein VGL22_08400 [Terracidiphilus sp.]
MDEFFHWELTNHHGRRMSGRVSSSEFAIKHFIDIVVNRVARFRHFQNLGLLQIDREIVAGCNRLGLCPFAWNNLIFRIESGDVMSQDKFEQMGVREIPTHHDGGSKRLVLKTKERFIKNSRSATFGTNAGRSLRIFATSIVLWRGKYSLSAKGYVLRGQGQ